MTLPPESRTPPRLRRLAVPAIFAAGLLGVLAGCDGSPSSGSGPSSASAPTPVVGHWTSDPTLSQLGRIVHTYDFAPDGTFAASFEFVDAKIPAMTSKGTYDTATRTLHAEGKSAGTDMTYAFDGDVLVLTERNKDSYRLKRP